MFTTGLRLAVPDQSSFNSDMAVQLFRLCGLCLPTDLHMCPHACVDCHKKGECHLCILKHPEVYQANLVRYSHVLGHLGAVQQMLSRVTSHTISVVAHTDGAGLVPRD